MAVYGTDVSARHLPKKHRQERPLKDAHRTSQQALFPNIGSPKIGTFFIAISISGSFENFRKNAPDSQNWIVS